MPPETRTDTKPAAEAAGIDFAPLQKLTKKVKAAQDELARYPKLERELREQAQEVATSLRKRGIDTLTPPVEGDQHFSDDAEREVNYLTTINTKLRLLPDCRRDQEQALAELNGRLLPMMEGIVLECREAARDRLAEMQSDLVKTLYDVCGGRVDHYRECLSFVIGKSAANDWLEYFKDWDRPTHPAEAVDRLIKMVRIFESGKPRPVS